MYFLLVLIHQLVLQLSDVPLLHACAKNLEVWRGFIERFIN